MSEFILSQLLEFWNIWSFVFFFILWLFLCIFLFTCGALNIKYLYILIDNYFNNNNWINKKIVKSRETFPVFIKRIYYSLAIFYILSLKYRTLILIHNITNIFFFKYNLWLINLPILIVTLLISCLVSLVSIKSKKEDTGKWNKISILLFIYLLIVLLLCIITFIFNLRGLNKEIINNVANIGIIMEYLQFFFIKPNSNFHFFEYLENLLGKKGFNKYICTMNSELDNQESNISSKKGKELLKGKENNEYLKKNEYLDSIAASLDRIKEGIPLNITTWSVGTIIINGNSYPNLLYDRLHLVPLYIRKDHPIFSDFLYKYMKTYNYFYKPNNDYKDLIYLKELLNRFIEEEAEIVKYNIVTLCLNNNIILSEKSVISDLLYYKYNIYNNNKNIFEPKLVYINDCGLRNRLLYFMNHWKALDNVNISNPDLHRYILGSKLFEPNWYANEQNFNYSSLASGLAKSYWEKYDNLGEKQIMKEFQLYKDRGKWINDSLKKDFLKSLLYYKESYRINDTEYNNLEKEISNYVDRYYYLFLLKSNLFISLVKENKSMAFEGKMENWELVLSQKKESKILERINRLPKKPVFGSSNN